MQIPNEIYKIINQEIDSMLILHNTTFKIKNNTRDTAFFVSDDEDGYLEYAIDVSTVDKEYEGQLVSPYLIINYIKTSAKLLFDLVGLTYEVSNIELANEREDTFYLYEHEPLEKYKISILSISDGKAHIKCEGTAITDGYSTPYETAKFQVDCWLPIITDKSDWAKFGL